MTEPLVVRPTLDDLQKIFDEEWSIGMKKADGTADRRGVQAIATVVQTTTVREVMSYMLNVAESNYPTSETQTKALMEKFMQEYPLVFNLPGGRYE